MKKAVVGMFTLAVLMCSLANVQHAQKSEGTAPKDKPAKVKTFTGTISDDGKSFTTDNDKKSWTIKNPEAVKGHEGRHVSVGVYVLDKDSIVVKAGPGTGDCPPCDDDKEKKDKM